MESEAEALARRAAGRLAGQFGNDLPAHVEAALQGGEAPPQRYEIATAIALATLVLEIAKFAWDIWKDTRKPATPSPSPDVIARRIRLEVSLPVGVAAVQRDQIITAVIDELPRS